MCWVVVGNREFNMNEWIENYVHSELVQAIIFSMRVVVPTSYQEM